MALEILDLTIGRNPYVPKTLNGFPFPSRPQARFLTHPAEEILYGGAAGGGKSAALLAAALQYAPVPGYSAILFRRTLTDLQLEGALIPMSHEWLGETDAEWDGQLHQWHFPGGGSLSFGYLKDQNDHFRYKGAAWQFVGFDELTSFEETPYRFLFGRLRKPVALNVPIRMRGASNPGDVGHQWVKERFIARQTPGRLFIPARLEDNPGLDRVSYERQLAKLDAVTRAQMRHGDWDVLPEGNLFRRAWFVNSLVSRFPAGLRWVRRWDLAATRKTPGSDPDWCVGLLAGADDADRFFIADVVRLRGTPQQVEDTIVLTAKRDGPLASVRLEQEPGASAKLYIDSLARLLAGYDVRGVPSLADKVTRAKPFSAACERGDVYLMRGAWNGAFLDELCAFPSVAHDDQVDTATGGYADLVGTPSAWSEEDWRGVAGYEDR